MARKTSSKKTSRKAPAAPARKSAAKKKPANAKTARKKAAARTAPYTVVKAKKLEALDAAAPKGSTGAPQPAGKFQRATAGGGGRVSSFPQTFIQQAHVSLDDPNHTLTLTWTGPDAAAQETGPFHTSPGAGLKGLNCDDVATSRRSGTLCTPKGTFAVESFADHLNSDARATHVTFFVRARGIGFHFFPTVPNFAASHGCVRIAEERIARLIQNNSRIGMTQVVLDGTWTKPAHQW